ncbi:MAG: formylmethanofuran--tetrahydromethanopterin formyltransferase [Promethearchaeota archaeon CR_4]|nr:MAG: formylmethanofuran--tetrahydromethanopterin formyltransferase [Candidatus Lokiarchaeota archaeon CR_4]
MQLNDVEIEDTFAEGFKTFACRVLVTALNEKWLREAANSACGFATSMIDCPCEAGVEKYVPASATPDHRPGVILMFCMGKKKKVGDKEVDNIGEVLMERLGQCVLTCPTTAVFDAFPKDRENDDSNVIAKTGYNLSFFGDGYQEKGGNEFPFPTYKIPVMDGVFVTQNAFRADKAVAGGNFMIMGASVESALQAAEAAVTAIHTVDYVITPFPGGVVRSGSKVGSLKYPKILKASSNHFLCPTLRTKVPGSLVPEGIAAVYEIVVDGLDEKHVGEAMKAGIIAATKVPGVKKITAGNYGGKLGPFKFTLKSLLGL